MVKGEWKTAFFAEYDDSKNIPKCLFLLKNRWCRLVIHSWTQIWTSCIFYNWQPMSAMLYRSGAYAWQCNNQSGISDGINLCDHQVNSVNTLFTVYVSAMSATALIAGWIYDYAGPFYSGATGQLVYFLGWVILIHAKQSFQSYIPASCLLGFSVMLIGFPGMSCRHLFPSHSALIISIITGAQTLATIVPLILDKIWIAQPHISYPILIWGYLLIIVVPTALLSVLSTPFHHPQMDSKSEQLQLSSASDLVTAVSYSNPKLELENSEEMKQSTQFKANGFKERAFDLWRDVQKLNFVLYTIWFIVAVVVVNFYLTIVESVKVDDVSGFLGYITAFQIIPCIAFGYVANKLGAVIVSGVVVVSNLISYGTLLSSSRGVINTGSVFFVISLSSTYTMANVYIDEAFEEKNFGMLIGITAAVSGVIVLINIPIQTYANNSKTFTPVILAYLVSTAVSSLLLIVVWLYDKRKRSAKETDVVKSVSEKSVCEDVLDDAIVLTTEE